MVFGRSMGGAVALALAEKHPEHIRAIILEVPLLSFSFPLIVFNV